MDTLSSITCFSTCSKSPFPRSSPKPLFKRNPPTFSLSRASSQPQPVRELAEGDVLKMFLKERELNGDFISKASDMFWLRDVIKFVDFDDGKLADTAQEVEQGIGSDDDGVFLKLSRTQEWISGDSSAPMNKKAIAEAMQDDSDRRKKLNFLRYEVLKRELMLLSVGIGTACSGYCLIVLSVQAAISYAIGVLFRIGIRSEDLRDSLLRLIKGSSIALASPRLVIPAAIYGLWIVPAMFGMFVYKAAALVQVYRDNEDLQFVFPENIEGSRD